MGNKNPYEIRLELLNMAKDNLTQQFYSQKEALNNAWQAKVSAAMENKGLIPEHPKMPDFPSEEQIIEKAMILEKFVSGSHRS